VTLSERFLSKVEVGDCWRWTASTTAAGYGQYFVGGAKKEAAHR
jgi:hypothetical protein